MLQNKYPGMLVALVMVSTSFSAMAVTDELRSTFNPNNIILPSSQYTPALPYEANVWVFNEGKRYADADYNRIWATPGADDEGNAWYMPGYNGEEGWSIQRAPFSSDAVYNGQTSYRWITSDITGEIYLRRTFTLDNVPDSPVYLACGHDDAPSEWYINGEMVHSVTDGWNNDEYVLLSDDKKALLKQGENIIAVHVHQNWGGAFADCGLYGADVTVTRTLLHTVADGSWPCKYYILNYNTDIEPAERAEWFGSDEDETFWIEGVGPFSNDRNMFLVTEWPSQVRPILVRRHFTLTADDMAAINNEDSRVVMTCSYDENPVMYLNGTQLWSASGWNDNDYARLNFNAEQKALLHEGDNILAVSLMQGAGGGHIDYGLAVEMPYSQNFVFFPVSEEKSFADNRIYDLYGRYISTDTKGLAPGIYIQNGKKLIIK
ncbi:MAG: hypothetical protein J1F20_01190 [Muribaculaceae bacterium]|nr:hypothetical protein [Muribaculaceae bacterium]